MLLCRRINGEEVGVIVPEKAPLTEILERLESGVGFFDIFIKFEPFYRIYRGRLCDRAVGINSKIAFESVDDRDT